MPARLVISIVDDDDFVRVSLGSLLRSYGHTTQLFDSAEQLIASGLADHTDCLVSDIQMPGMTGLRMYEVLVSQGIHLPVIFITASIDHSSRLAAQKLGAIGYLLKPFDGESLMACLDIAFGLTRPV